MKNLLYKELKLVLHPINIMFLAFSSMLMIPSYPYFIIAFYACLGIFMMSITARENKDDYYSMMLPIKKSETVKARFLMATFLESLQVVIAIPFALMNLALYPAGNQAGMDPTPAFFGFLLVLFGVFNLIFFTRYYKDTSKVGVPFLWGCIGIAVLMILIEGVSFAKIISFASPQAQLTALTAGIILYILLTFAAYKKSVKSFECMDF